MGGVPHDAGVGALDGFGGDDDLLDGQVGGNQHQYKIAVPMSSLPAHRHDNRKMPYF